MNNVILAKWRIELSNNIEVLGNHWCTIIRYDTTIHHDTTVRHDKLKLDSGKR